MKVFISCDIEGVTGICHWNETEREYSEYFDFQKQMIRETNAAIRGAKKGGADLIYVKDAHYTARNLVPYELSEDAILNRGWSGNLCSMMDGLTSEFDKVIYIGYHSEAGSLGNSLSHTMASSTIQNITINNVRASEFLINSLYASYLGVSVCFLSGDKALCEWAKRYDKNIETVITKEGKGNASISRHPNITEKEIEQLCEKAVKKTLKPLCLPSSFVVTVEYKKAHLAYSAQFYPGAYLVNDNTVGFTSDDYLEVLRFFKFVL